MAKKKAKPKSKPKAKAVRKATAKAPRVPNDNTQRKKNAFLAAYVLTGNISCAAKAAKIERVNHYHWLNDPVYRQAFRLARKEASDVLEAEARRRAIVGLKRLKFHNGKPVIDPTTKEQYYEHEYSDTLLIFLMKGANPRKYRERYDIDQKVSVADFQYGGEDPDKVDAQMIEELKRQILENQKREADLKRLES